MTQANTSIQLPQGEMLLRTVAMPADTNANGDIFGGWLMSQLDLAGAILAKEISGGRVVTVSVDEIQFKAPVSVGDVICCYGQCTRIGNTSMNILLEIWSKSIGYEEIGERYCACQGSFNYVAIDSDGRPKSIKQ